MLYNEPPSLVHLKVIGFLCYATSLQAHKKIDSTGRKVIFLSFKNDTKVYILYDLTSNNFSVSRNVIFYESYFPFEVNEPILHSFPTECITSISLTPYDIIPKSLPAQLYPQPGNQPHPLPDSKPLHIPLDIIPNSSLVSIDQYRYPSSLPTTSTFETPLMSSNDISTKDMSNNPLSLIKSTRLVKKPTFLEIFTIIQFYILTRFFILMMRILYHLFFLIIIAHLHVKYCIVPSPYTLNQRHVHKSPKLIIGIKPCILSYFLLIIIILGPLMNFHQVKVLFATGGLTRLSTKLMVPLKGTK